ncbi:unnamed protein product [Fraxinus pennsylvanica]|uniref:Non-haem dioxygenase N-terminal domain-containing protein n=1 Tax=Fraxinus pennsylvanica TaxID=56036 RepID=A0AAD1ZIL3_9LAMI|nr:unnamed protein product [Fraxinus pennsylvanica]
MATGSDTEDETAGKEYSNGDPLDLQNSDHPGMHFDDVQNLDDSHTDTVVAPLPVLPPADPHPEPSSPPNVSSDSISLIPVPFPDTQSTSGAPIDSSPHSESTLPSLRQNEEVYMEPPEGYSKASAGQIVNHGIPMQVLESVKNATHKFYGLPAEEKKKYSKEESPTNNVRYGTSFSPLAEKALEWKDWLSLFYHFDDVQNLDDSHTDTVVASLPVLPPADPHPEPSSPPNVSSDSIPLIPVPFPDTQSTSGAPIDSSPHSKSTLPSLRQSARIKSQPSWLQDYITSVTTKQV